jgi:hypothetical protein
MTVASTIGNPFRIAWTNTILRIPRTIHLGRRKYRSRWGAFTARRSTTATGSNGESKRMGRAIVSSLWQKSRGRCLCLWAGFFVVETRSYFNEYCFVSTPRIRPKSPAHRRAGLLPKAATDSGAARSRGAMGRDWDSRYFRWIPIITTGGFSLSRMTKGVGIGMRMIVNR